MENFYSSKVISSTKTKSSNLACSFLNFNASIANFSFIAIFSLFFGSVGFGQTYTATYNYTNAPQTFTVPAGVTSITVRMWGAGGGGSCATTCGSGGSGAFVKGDLAVTPGQSYVIVVGGGGGASSTGSSAATYGGGGIGYKYGGSGGGYSGIFLTSLSFANAKAIAGGGGGGGFYSAATNGGGGGNTTGTSGGDRTATTFQGGRGATISAGGAAGAGTTVGTAGAQLQGGNGGNNATYGGGGGGGGYYGGGGGYGSASTTNYSSGGGGGSSYTSILTTVTNTVGSTNTAGAAPAAMASTETGYTTGIGLGGTGYVAGGNGRVVITFTCTAAVAPTTISGTTTICNSSSTTLTASGGTTGTEGIYYWYSGGCPANAFAQHWTDNTNPYTPSTTTVNSVNGGYINLTSTNTDPNLNMTGLGSFAPATYKYINVRFRVTSATQIGGMEIFWYNTAYTTANALQYKSVSITSVQNVWQTVSIDMSTPTAGTWTSSNVTGWRFDWTTNSGVTMDIDFVSFSSQPIIAEGTGLTVSPSSNTTYYSAIQNACGLTTCKSQLVTVNALPTAGSIGTAQTICSGGTPNAFTSTANGTGLGTISYQWQTNASGSYVDIASQTAATYSPPSLTATTSYQRRTADLSGGITCYSAYTTPVAITVNAVPSSGSVTSNPASGPLCAGTSVSASVSGGSGGAGTIADVLEYSSNGGAWTAYSAAVTAATSSLQFRTRRTATGNGCTTSSDNTATAITVNAQPSSGTVTSNPASGPICAGASVTASVSGGAGGAGTINDVIEYSSNGGAWTTYSSAVTAAASSLQFRTYRTASTSGCTSSTPNTATSITVRAISTTPTVTSPICAGNTTISGTGVAGSTIEVFIGGVSQGTTTVSGTAWSITVAAVSEGNSITATQTETGKCVSATTAAVSVGASISNLSYSSPVSYCTTVAISNNSPTLTGTGTITYSSATLPTGLTINSGTGIISGTPSAAVAAANYLVTANNGCNSTTFNVNIAVNTTPTISGSTPAARCDAGTVSLGATASAGTINWYAASTGGASLGTGTSFTTPSISTTTTYYVDATASGCATTSRTSVVATVNTTPSISGTTPATRCGTGTVSLGVTASAGTINWYNASTGGASLGTGTSYTTPSISSTTIYYVDATANSCTSGSRTAVTATITPTPTQASSVITSSLASTSVTVGFTRGTGSNVILVAYPGSSAGTTPTTTYTANAAYGLGSALGTGYVVYDGTASPVSVNVTGLSSSTQYTFVAYEYNTGACYNTATSASTTITTTCTAPTTTASITSFTSTSSTGTTVNWTNGNGSYRIVVARLNATTAVDPTTGNSYSANSVFGSGSSTGTGNFVVYSGTGTSVAVTGLTASSLYAFTVYEANSTCYQSGLTSTINTSTYCSATCSTCGTADIMTKVVLTNSLSSNYTNNSTYTSPNYYDVYNNTPLNLVVGSTTNTLAITFGTDGTQASAAWIDFNNNGTFESTENIALASSLAAGSATVTYTFTVPATATYGTTRMRVRGGADAVANYTAAGACTSTTYGETEDYLVNIVAAPYSFSVTSVNYGASTWCTGETRSVTATIKNTGTATWYASGSFTCPAPTNNNQVAVSYKWNADSGWDVYNNRNTLPSNVAPGATVNVTFNVQSPNGNPTGSNNLAINLIAQECAWFTSTYTSPAITVNGAIAITAHPSTSTQTQCQNGTAFTALSVTATGTSPTYQWQQSTDGSTGWVSVTAGTGGTTASYTPSNASVGTLYFRCVVSGASSCGSVTSNVSGLITVNSSPTTVAVNTAGTYCTSTTITASNGSSGTIYYQGTTSNGTSTATPSSSQSISTNGTYYFRAYGSGCWGTQGSAAITINTPAAITSHPSTSTQVQCQSGSAFTALNVTATGTSITYQWQQSTDGSTGWTNVTAGTGGTTASYTPSNGTVGTLYFRCLVSDVSPCVGSLTSNVSGAITVTTIPSNPATPTSNSPQCASPGVTLTATGSAPAGETWYWQTSASGTATTSSASTYNVSTTGTYYIRSRNNSSLCWSSGAGSLSITISTVPSQPSAITGTLNPIPGATGQTYSVTNVSGVTYTWTLPSGWSITAGQGSNSITVTVGSTNGTISATPSNSCGSGTAITATTTIPNYRAQITSVNYGASTWDPGTSRSVTVTVKNTGTSTWSDASPDINIGVKWATNGSNWADYYYRQNAGSLTPGSSQTYTFSDLRSMNATALATAPSAPSYSSNLSAGTNYLYFDLVYEGCFWFGSNTPGASCSATATSSGNTVYQTAAITINAPIGENCTNPQDLSTLTSPYSASTIGYADDISACRTGYADRIFYLDVPNNYTITFQETTNDYDEYEYIGYGSTCTSTTQIQCWDNDALASTTWTNTTGSTQRVWYVQDAYSGSGNFTISWVLTPPAPTSIGVAETSGTANDGTICNGSSATLTANGAVGTVYWFTGSCATTGQIGTGNSITVSPTTTTTYYARNYSGGQWSTSCSSTTITVNSAASITSVTGTSPLCSNAAASTYTANGVVLSGGTGTWSSSNMAVASVDASTGAVTPAGAGTANIIYTITGGCGSTVSAQQAITINSAPTVSYTGSPYTFCLLNAISSLSPTTTGSPTSFSIGTTLPTGMSFNSTTGVISGTPTASSSATSYTITATSANTCTNTAVISITTKSGPSNVNAGYDVAICSGTSTQLSGSATAPTVLYNSDFSSLTGWTTNDGNRWYSGATNNAGGTASEATFQWFSGSNPTTIDANLQSPLITATGWTNLTMSFKHMVDWYTGTVGPLTVETSTNGTTWTSRWTLSPTADVAASTVSNIDLTALNGQSFYVRFRHNGNIWNLNYWYIDDIIITGTSQVSYAWSPSTALSANNVFNPIANPTSNVTYTMTATTNGCSVSDQVDVSMRTIPAATATNNGPVCAGNTINLTASNMAPSGQVVTMTNNGSDAISGINNSSNTSNHTVEFWVNPNRTIVLHSQVNSGISGNLSAPTTEYSFAIYPVQGSGSPTPTNVGVGVSVGTNGVEVVQHGASHFPVTLSYSASLSGWTHIAVVHISNVPYLYVNGNLVKVGLSSLYTTFPGSGVSMAYGYFSGSIDNVRTWSSSRTVSDILSNMNLETPTSTTGLIQNLPLNGNGTALTGSNATISGSSYATPTVYTYTWSGTSAPAASTAATQTTGTLGATGNYTVVASSATCAGNSSASTTVTINNPSVATSLSANDYVWNGVSSTSFNTTTNWLQWNGSSYSIPSGYPNASTANVILPSTGSCVYNTVSIPAGTFATNNLTVESGQTLALANTASILNVAGNFTMNGTWTTPTSGSTVNFNGSGAQNIPALTYSNLQTSTGGTKTLVGATTASGAVTINSGSTLNLSSQTFTLTGTGSVLSVSGTLTPATSTVDFANTTGTQNLPAVTFNNISSSGFGTRLLSGNVTANGNVINSDGTLDLNNYNLTIGGNYANSVMNGLNPGTGSVIFNKASGTQTLSMATGADFSNVIHNAAGTLQLASDLSMTGNLTNSSGTLDVNGYNIVISGNWTNSATFLPGTGSTYVAFDGSSPATQLVDNGTSQFNNVRVIGTAIVSMTNPNTYGNVLVNGPLSSNASVTLIGGDSQTISSTYYTGGSPIPFQNITVNKSSGTTVTLSQPVQVSGVLTMTQGDLVTTTNNILEVGTSATNTGSVSWTSGTVRGPMKRWFASSTNSTQASGLFPVGGSIPGKGVLNRYAQVNFTSAPGTGGYIIAEYKTGTNSVGYNGLPIWTSTQYIQNYEEEGYWDITPYSAAGQAYQAMNTTPYTLKLRLNTPSTNDGSYITSPERLRIISSKGPAHNSWVLAGNQGAGQTQTTQGDYLLEETGVTGFSWFNGAGDNFNPLPVELISFSGICEENKVSLEWKTASEHNSSYFDVEKSRDGENWQVITTVPAAGNSNSILVYNAIDENAAAGNNYYRLKQVDIDGVFKMYSVINIGCLEETKGYFSSFPNPSGGPFQLVLNNKDITGACILNIVDSKGSMVVQKEIDVKEGINMYVINESMLPGIYFINITNGNKSTEVIRHSVK